MKAIILFTLALVVMVTGGCASVERVQAVAGKVAAKQCDRSPLERWLSQAASQAALDGQGLLRLYCPGDAEYDNFQQSVQTAYTVFGHVQSGDYRKAVSLLANIAVEQGIEVDAPLDETGCIVNGSGWRLCPPGLGDAQ